MLECGEEGDSDDNVYVAIHARLGSTIEIILRRHLGNAQVDTDASCTEGAYDALACAIQDGATDAQVHTIGRAAFGTAWYNAHISGVPEAYAQLRHAAARWLRL